MRIANNRGIKSSILADIVSEVESLPKKDKEQMLDAIRKRKAFLTALKVDQKTRKNNISMEEIVTEVKKVRKQRNRKNGTS